ncbi:uncharacterized protein EI90DRAFT_3159781 [Cantharellus anzutake]|uniref:uncharacterized protein n=1 Tax=Cantharellus anzutake TaxID=1750568 RepID=UPI0019059BAA|nr:uncharacterized protein EI90DRAFT_3159781 [Cantharellus anzutake]KAF8313165.1 hypothetical protein EI90DRAFT_3159781 [Cantharellus anzutake]
MSLRQTAEGLRRKIDEILAAGGDMAIPILTAVNVAADMFPPLKSATNGALFIIGEVQKFKENKKEWEDFGKYVVENVAEVVAAIKSYDPSTEEAKPWVESAEKLDRVLQKIKFEIEQRRTKVEKRSAFVNALSHLRDPGRIDALKKDLDKALASFQLRTNLTIGVKLLAMGDDSILGRLRYPDIAHYDSTQACLEGTRVGLIERIMAWCHNTADSENRLASLSAVAGAGKTSIAHTIAERCKREGTLLLCFFFREGEQSRPDCLFSGIAQSLANRDSVYRIVITSTLRKDPTLSTASFTMQFKELVASPLLHKHPCSDHPMVVIIDALDECDEEAFEPLANILREEVPKLPSSIKFFITSRQFDRVNRFLSSHPHIDRLTIDLSDDANVQDCAMYIRSQLQTLKNWHPDIRHRLEDEEKAVEGILERAGGLFVWISTIFRYMRKASKDLMRTLEGLLSTGVKGSAVSAEGMMDRLYSSILKKCGWEDEDFGHDYPVVMGAIFVAQQPLSVAAWDAILSPFLKSSVRSTLAELAPLLSGLEDPDNPIRILHQSFRDFILERINPQLISLRCNPVDVGRENARIALRCTEVLNQDLPSLEGLGLIEDLHEKDELPRIPREELSEHLHYACRYIVYHLSGIQEQSQELDKSVRTFLSQQATRWVEVCVRMEGYISVSILPEWAELVVDQRSIDAVCMLANLLSQLQLNLRFFLRFREAYEAADDSVALCRCLVSVDSESYTPKLAWSLGILYLTLLDLGRHSEALPFIKESVKLYRQLVAVHPGYTPGLALSLNRLYLALSNLGRYSEALPFIEESVKLWRELVAIHPGSYTPDLARSLNNLFPSLSKLGRHSEALPFIMESVRLYRELVAVHPGFYTPELAQSLSNLSLSLSNLGQHSEALPFIDESVKLRRELVAIHPRSYTPDLAQSLNNLYLSLSNLGQHSEALPFIEESVKLQRELVAIHPGSYTPDLARSLNNLFLSLSKLGRHSEALPFITESVKLWREPVAVHPGSYTPDLAQSLNNLYISLSNLGQHSEALPSIDESVKLWRELVAIHPGLYTSDLARSLNNLYHALSNLGWHLEALPFIEESIKVQRNLVAVYPQSYNADLARSLNSLYGALSNLGRHSEALPFIEESVKLQRELVAVHAGSYTPDLAWSLNSLYHALSNLGRHLEALPFIEESVKLQRDLVAVHPGLDLAWSLNSLYGALSNLGRHSEALPFIEESVKLRRELVAVHPRSCTPYLAWSLDNLYLALSNLGRYSEALPFIQESAKLYHELVVVNPGLHASNLDWSLNALRTTLSDLGRDSEALI